MTISLFFGLLVLFTGCIKEQKTQQGNKEQKQEKVEKEFDKSKKTNKINRSEEPEVNNNQHQGQLVGGRITAVIHCHKGYIGYYVVKKVEDNRYELLSSTDSFTPESKQTNSANHSDPKKKKKGMIDAIIGEITNKTSKVDKYYALCEKSIQDDTDVKEYYEVITQKGGISWATYDKSDFEEVDDIPIAVQFVLNKPYYDN